MTQEQPALFEDMPDKQIDDTTHAAERALFEHMLDGMPFADLYAVLLEEGWYWRDAAYIAWLSLPKRIRQPVTVGELANVLGISGRALRLRRQQKPAMDIRAAKMVVGERIFRDIDDVVDALMESAASPGYKHHPDRKLVLEMAGVHTPKQGLVIEAAKGSDDDLADASEDDLRRLAARDAGGAS